MLYIDNDVINLTRGDDAELAINLTQGDGSAYEMSSEEYLIFGIRETPTEDSPIILELTSEGGSNKIVFQHSDTEDLSIGFYSAEVQLMTEDHKRITVWPKLSGGGRTSKSNRKNFCLMTEVIRQ